MKLTRTERWILVNQYRILEALYPDEAEGLREKRTALEEGFELHYHPEGILAGDEVMTEDECREVLTILDMYRALTFSADELKLKGRADFDEATIRFRGFDGNNEAK